jgi:hypothetical protein
LLRAVFSKHIVHLYAYTGVAKLRQHLKTDVHISGVNNIAFSHPNNQQLCVITCGDDKAIKIVGMLTPEQDWSVRIVAMQRVEGMVFGGAPDYGFFPALLKQLVGPLIVQLSDRRSSIVKHACHLLSLLSKELLGDFEACAELLIPVLFKLVFITVLVIVESTDN